MTKHIISIKIDQPDGLKAKSVDRDYQGRNNCFIIGRAQNRLERGR